MRARSSDAFTCMRAGISSERSSRRKSVILILLPGTGRGTASQRLVVEGAVHNRGNRSNDRIDILQNVESGNSKHLIPVLVQKGVAGDVMCRAVAHVMRVSI